jgi:hypothetical protein
MRDWYQDRRAKPKPGKKRLRIRLPWPCCIDHDRISIGIDTADKLFGKIRILHLKDTAAFCDDSYPAIFDLIIGYIRTVKVITDGCDDQIEQPVPVRFRKEGLSHIEQGPQRRNTRRVTLALIIGQRLADSLKEFLTLFERLQDQPIHTLAQRTNGRFNRAKAGHDQNRNVWLDYLRAGYDIEAIHLRHSDIDQQQVKMVLLDVFDCNTRVSQRRNSIARAAQDAVA